jgi:hypothetical protein
VYLSKLNGVELPGLAGTTTRPNLAVSQGRLMSMLEGMSARQMRVEQHLADLFMPLGPEVGYLITGMVGPYRLLWQGSYRDCEVVKIVTGQNVVRIERGAFFENNDWHDVIKSRPRFLRPGDS